MKTVSKPKLILVYNADSGFFNALSSSVHKALSPETYECNLCRITYGMTKMDAAWKSYLDALPFAVEALHRNEFQTEYTSMVSEALPAIFLVNKGSVNVLLDAATIERSDDITSLIELLDAAIKVAGTSAKS